MPTEIERVSSPYNDVVVRTRGDWVDLDVRGATHATWHPRLMLTGYSWDALCAATLLTPEGPPASVLLLGLGGGTCLRPLRHLLPEARIVAVEIDPEIVRLAERYMHVRELGVHIEVADAFAFLRSCRERFDVVIDDLFLSGIDDVERATIPEGPWLKTLQGRATPRGTVVCNLIIDGAHMSVRRRARRAFRDTFARTRVVTPPRGLNEALVGGSAVAPPSTLGPFADRFSERRDRERWRELRVDLLRGR